LTLDPSHLYVRADADLKGEAGIYPYRAYDLIEFYKIILEKGGDIIAIELDVEDHSISFVWRSSEKKEVQS